MSDRVVDDPERRAAQFLRTDALFGVPFVPLRPPSTTLDDVIAAYARATEAAESLSPGFMVRGTAPHARLLFVRERPSEEEMAAGRPGVGSIGEKVGDLVRATRLRPEAVRVTFLERPGTPPPPTEPAGLPQGMEWLDLEISAVRPAVLVAMGARVAAALAGDPSDAQSSEAPLGEWRKASALSPGNRDIDVLAFVDPSVLVNAPADALRRAVWTALKDAVGRAVC